MGNTNVALPPYISHTGCLHQTCSYTWGCVWDWVSETVYLQDTDVAQTLMLQVKQ